MSDHLHDAPHDPSHGHGIEVPRQALIAAGLLIGLTIAAVAAFRIAGLEPSARIPASEPPVLSRELRFADGDDGSVIVYAADGSGRDRVIHVVHSGEGGFIRGILRSLARARTASGIGREHPFILRQQPSGTLLLEDPQTHQRIDLQAFGPTNIESFRVLLVDQETPS